MNIFTAFSRAAANLSLTPQERAWLKLVQGAVWAALIAAGGTLYTLMAHGQFAINQATLVAVATAGMVALLNAVTKLVSATGDTTSVAGPLHQQSAPPEAPASPATAPSAADGTSAI